jgi:acetyl esterase/lipase
MTLRSVVVVCGALALAGTSLRAGQQGAPNEGRPPAGPRLTIDRNLEYSRADGQPLLLDIYRPDPVSTPTPVVVWIHGTNGGDTTRMVTPAVALASSGYAVASIDYRSAVTAPIEARVADAKAAVRWLRANAQRFNIDATKIGAFGYDSGATVAAILGTSADVVALDGGAGGQTSRVQAVVAAAGAVDRTQRVNPLAYVTKDDAPTLLLHGTADATVPTLQSQALISALKVAVLTRRSIYTLAFLTCRIDCSHPRRCSR